MEKYANKVVFFFQLIKLDQMEEIETRKTGAGMLPAVLLGAMADSLSLEAGWAETLGSATIHFCEFMPSRQSERTDLQNMVLFPVSFMAVRNCKHTGMRYKGDLLSHRMVCIRIIAAFNICAFNKYLKEREEAKVAFSVEKKQE